MKRNILFVFQILIRKFQAVNGFKLPRRWIWVQHKHYLYCHSLCIRLWISVRKSMLHTHTHLNTQRTAALCNYQKKKCQCHKQGVCTYSHIKHLYILQSQSSAIPHLLKPGRDHVDKRLFFIKNNKRVIICGNIGSYWWSYISPSL